MEGIILFLILIFGILDGGFWRIDSRLKRIIDLLEEIASKDESNSRGRL